MERFDRSEEAAESKLASERLQSFIEALWEGSVRHIPAGECASVQCELVRVNGRLASEYYRNAMGNYYWDEPAEVTDLAATFFGKMLLFMLDTLVANRNDALEAEDVAYFEKRRQAAPRDYVRRRRIEVLEGRQDDADDLTDEEATELEALEESETDPFWWEELFNRAEWAIANWCVANPALIDREGRPVEEGGARTVEEIVTRGAADGGK